MAEYYFDIETCSRTAHPDFNNDPIIAITYQQIDSRTGQAIDKLNILKSWESSEEEILRKFHPIFNLQDKWKFIPIGCNLSFDFVSLICRWKKIGIETTVRNLFTEHPYIDIQPILVIFNRGSFKDCSLQKFAGKQHSGSKIIEWYDKSEYQEIQSYIEDETEIFLRLYRFLVQRLPNLWDEFAKGCGIIV